MKAKNRLSVKNRYRFGWNKSDYLAQRAILRHQVGGSLSSVAVIEVAEKLSGGRYECVSFKKGELKLGFTDYDQLVELKFTKNDLINEINEKLQKPLVKEILFAIKY